MKSTIKREEVGGWKVLRERTDKPPNASFVAKNIMKTISKPVSKEDLIDVVEDLTADDFNLGEVSMLGSKRSRSEIDEDGD